MFTGNVSSRAKNRQTQPGFSRSGGTTTLLAPAKSASARRIKRKCSTVEQVASKRPVELTKPIQTDQWNTHSPLHSKKRCFGLISGIHHKLPLCMYKIHSVFEVHLTKMEITTNLQFNATVTEAHTTGAWQRFSMKDGFSCQST